MTSMLMSSPSISILHQLFQCRYSNSGNVVASSPCVSHLAARESQRACWQARTDQAFRYWVILVLKANIDVLTLVTSLVSVVFFFSLQLSPSSKRTNTKPVACKKLRQKQIWSCQPLVTNKRQTSFSPLVQKPETRKINKFWIEIVVFLPFLFQFLPF